MMRGAWTLRARIPQPRAVLREAMANGAMGKREEALQTGSQWDVLGIVVGFKNLMVERHGWLSKNYGPFLGPYYTTAPII